MSKHFMIGEVVGNHGFREPVTTLLSTGNCDCRSALKAQGIEFAGLDPAARQVYGGEHEHIVDDETWNKVQSTLNRNGHRGGRNLRNKYGALRKGLLRCATCNLATHVELENRVNPERPIVDGQEVARQPGATWDLRR